MISQRTQNGLVIFTMECEALRVELAPALGGKFTSIYNKRLNAEFLWHNRSLELEKLEPGANYDRNFWGGIDELLPNDIPEEVDGIAYPDHGELWTTALDYELESQCLVLSGTLPLSGLFYKKVVSLHEREPKIKVRYQLHNRSGSTRHFLWKMHAALKISEGDVLLSPARKARIVYANASRFKNMNEFRWPVIEDVDASRVPAKDGTMDFFYLYETPVGEMTLVSASGATCFSYKYDTRVFPYQWYFASYGQFRDHYTAILEPASAMPVSVPEATALGQCSVLEPGGAMETEVVIFAGERESVQ
jgi:hypothetical protein